jgi:hypothetical protein
VVLDPVAIVPLAVTKDVLATLLARPGSNVHPVGSSDWAAFDPN